MNAIKDEQGLEEVIVELLGTRGIGVVPQIKAIHKELGALSPFSPVVTREGVIDLIFSLRISGDYQLGVSAGESGIYKDEAVVPITEVARVLGEYMKSKRGGEKVSLEGEKVATDLIDQVDDTIIIKKRRDTGAYFFGLPDESKITRPVNGAGVWEITAVERSAPGKSTVPMEIAGPRVDDAAVQDYTDDSHKGSSLMPSYDPTAQTPSLGRDDAFMVNEAVRPTRPVTLRGQIITEEAAARDTMLGLSRGTEQRPAYAIENVSSLTPRRVGLAALAMAVSFYVAADTAPPTFYDAVVAAAKLEDYTEMMVAFEDAIRTNCYTISTDGVVPKGDKSSTAYLVDLLDVLGAPLNKVTAPLVVSVANELPVGFEGYGCPKL